MSVQAKFKVDSIERSLYYGNDKELQNIKMSPVTNGSEENKKFYAYTPCGQISLGTVNADAANYFELGKEYMLTFEKANK